MANDLGDLEPPFPWSPCTGPFSEVHTDPVPKRTAERKELTRSGTKCPRSAERRNPPCPRGYPESRGPFPPLIPPAHGAKGEDPSAIPPRRRPPDLGRHHPPGQTR